MLALPSSQHWSASTVTGRYWPEAAPSSVDATHDSGCARTGTAELYRTLDTVTWIKDAVVVGVPARPAKLAQRTQRGDS